MKTTLLLLTALLGATLSTHAASITRLGGLHTSISSTAFGISADGRVVVGDSWNADLNREAFRWTAEAGMAGLGDFPGGDFRSTAFGTSADGNVVVGRSTTADVERAFRWTAAGGMVGLVGTGPATNSDAIAASMDGSVIVGSRWADISVAFRWTAGSGMAALNGLSETNESGAYGVSADGSVVVGYGATTNGGEAFRWTVTNGVEWLGDLPGADVSAWASAVSADGQVVVGGGAATNHSEAFRWTRASGMVPLGVLPGNLHSQADAVSADGNTVIGFCWDEMGAMTAFVWTHVGGMQKLADFLTARGVDMGQWQSLWQAKGISADGRWVCGYGLTTSGTEEAFLADLGPVVTLQPVEDAYLSSSGSEADQTWNSTVLDQFGYYSAYKRPLLKFDLSSIPDGATILSARLTMELQGIYGGQGHSTTVWRMPNDNWNETNVTWNSYSQTGAVVVASLPGTGQLGDRVWHIQLADWPYAADLADDAVTFQTRWETDGYGGWEGDGYYKANSYSSKEGSVAPTLRIEYASAPAAPMLSITRTNEFITVFWTAPSDGWRLERTNALGGASATWPPVPPPYRTNAGTVSATFTNAPAVGNQFFRLHKL